MWKAYYRRQALRLFGLLIQAEHEQANVSWPRAVLAAVWLTKGAVGFARSSGDYDRFLPEHRPRLPDPGRAAPRSTWKRWPAASCAGGSCGARSAWPPARRQGRPSRACTRRSTTCPSSGWPRPDACAASRPRSATAVRPTIRTGRSGPGRAYWPEVARLLDESYVSLAAAISARGGLTRQFRAGSRGTADSRPPRPRRPW